MDEFKDKQVSFLWNVILYTSLVFLVFFVFYGFKVSSDETCTSKSFSNSLSVDDQVLVNSVVHRFKLNTPDKYSQNIERVNVCLFLSGNSSDYLEVDVNGVSVYVNSDTSGLTCAQDVNVVEDYLEYSCVNCDVNNALTVSLANQEQITLTGETVTKEKVAYHKTFLIEHCKELYKDFIQIYFAILLCYLFIFLIIRGTKWFERWVNNG